MRIYKTKFREQISTLNYFDQRTESFGNGDALQNCDKRDQDDSASQFTD